MISNRTAYIFMILTCLLWAANSIVGKVLVADISPATITFLRWVPASILFLPLSFKYLMRDKKIILDNWVVLVLQGTTGMALFPHLLYTALQNTTVLNISLMIGICPAIVGVINHILSIERMNLHTLFYSVLSFIAVVIIGSEGDIENLKTLQFNIGDITAFIALCVWSIYLVLTKYTPKKLHVMSSIQSQMIVGALWSIPLMLIVSGAEITMIEWTPTLIASEAFLVIGVCVISYYLFSLSAGVVGSLSSSAFLNLIPIFSSVFSVLLLGETVYIYHIVSMVLLAISIYKILQKKYSQSLA